MHWHEYRGKLKWTALWEDLVSGLKVRQLLVLLVYMAGIADIKWFASSGLLDTSRTITELSETLSDCLAGSVDPVHETLVVKHFHASQHYISCIVSYHNVTNYPACKYLILILWVNWEIIGLGKPTPSWVFSALFKKQSSAHEETVGMASVVMIIYADFELRLIAKHGLYDHHIK